MEQDEMLKSEEESVEQQAAAAAGEDDAGANAGNSGEEAAAGATGKEVDAGEGEEPAPAEPSELAEVLESRATFYEMLSSLYFKPLTQEEIDHMAETDFSAYMELGGDFADGFNDIYRYLRRRNTGTRQDLAVDFTGAFTGTSAWEGKTAVPYKSVFTSEEGLMYQEGYHEVAAAFRHEAIKRREGLDWPDDHLSFMCQFMAIMSRRVEEDLEAGDYEKAKKDLNSSRDFLDKHIASWFEDFADIANKLLKTRFYRGVIKITRGYIKLDRETLDDLLEEVEGMEADEQPEEE